MIDLMKLQAFLYAAESLSSPDAANRLHLSQPTISHHIKSLEQELGVELFARSGSGLKLTDAGRLLMSQASKVLDEANAVEQMMDSLQEKIWSDHHCVQHDHRQVRSAAGSSTLPPAASRRESRSWPAPRSGSCPA